MDSETNLASAPPGRRSRFHLGALRFSMAQFLIVLICLLITDPFVEQMEYGKTVETALVTLVLLSAVLAVGGGRRTLTWAIVLVIPALVGRWSHHFWGAHVFPAAGLGPSLVFIVFIVANLLRYILRAPRVTSEVLYAGVANYLMLGVLWANAYVLVAHVMPSAFVFTAGPPTSQSMQGFNGLYFSFVTLSTVGYGDIIPIAPVARLLAIAEATVGMIYMTVLVARLVALYSSEQPNDEKEKDDESQTT
jgi:hypothetical protein